MAYESNLQRAATHGFADKLSAVYADFRAGMARRKIYRETLRELNALSNRELNDLGLNRSELKRIAYQAAYEQ